MNFLVSFSLIVRTNTISKVWKIPIKLAHRIVVSTSSSSSHHRNACIFSNFLSLLSEKLFARTFNFPLPAIIFQYFLHLPSNPPSPVPVMSHDNKNISIGRIESRLESHRFDLFWAIAWFSLCVIMESKKISKGRKIPEQFSFHRQKFSCFSLPLTFLFVCHH